MCLVFVAIGAHPDHPLVIAANRDEFYERPTAGVHFWDQAPAVLAGRDLVGGGTWFGIDRRGRWAAVTNYREPHPAAPGAPDTSRGHLVRDYLLGSAGAKQYAEQVLAHGSRFAGFNLLTGDARRAVHCSNRDPKLTILQEGVHGLSNHLLDTPWPKLVRGRDRLTALLAKGGPLEFDAIFEILGDREEAPLERLPDTGVGCEWERVLSPAFIATDGYGTRSSTVLSLDREGQIVLTERQFLETESGRYHPGHYQSSTRRLSAQKQQNEQPHE